MMEAFTDAQRRQTAVAYLEEALASGKVTHAYLLVGDEDSGKEDVALRFASALVAGDDEGEFQAARRLAHPDVHVYEPDGIRTYSIALVRELAADASLAPIRSSRKVYIVTHAEALAESSANALLKTLEEPPPDAVLVLLAEREGSVLDTIRSRCELLSFAGSSARPDGNPEVFAMVGRLAASCDNRTLLADASRFVELSEEEGEGIERRRQEEFERISDFISGKAAKDYEERTGKLVKASQQKALDEELDAVASWLRDCLLVQQGAPELSVCPGEAPRVLQVATSATASGVLEALSAVNSCRERFTYNVSPQLAVEAMFIEIREALCQQ